jgi:hypothetical protein
MQRISALSKTLAPYFDVVGIVVQTEDYAALAWGGFRLVLQVMASLLDTEPICAHHCNS